MGGLDEDGARPPLRKLFQRLGHRIHKNAVPRSRSLRMTIGL
jgi:hypothetical protein